MTENLKGWKPVRWQNDPKPVKVIPRFNHLPFIAFKLLMDRKSFINLIIYCACRMARTTMNRPRRALF